MSSKSVTLVLSVMSVSQSQNKRPLSIHLTLMWIKNYNKIEIQKEIQFERLEKRNPSKEGGCDFEGV